MWIPVLTASAIVSKAIGKYAGLRLPISRFSLSQNEPVLGTSRKLVLRVRAVGLRAPARLSEPTRLKST